MKKTINIKCKALPLMLTSAIESANTQKELNEIARSLGISIGKYKYVTASWIAAFVHNNRDKVTLTITIEK